jgi:hypothetical protein
LPGSRSCVLCLVPILLFFVWFLFFFNLCTRWSLTDSDDTRCCINTI